MSDIQAASHTLYPPIVGNLFSTSRAALGIPQNVSSNPGDGAVLFSWDAVANATSYDIIINNGAPIQLGDVQQYSAMGPNNVPILFEVIARVGTITSLESNQISGTPQASGPSGFSELFETVAASANGWYDGGADNHAVGTNPNGGNAYVHPYQIGDIGDEIGGTPATTQTLRRKLSAPSDIIDISFQGWSDNGFVPHDGDHLLYVRLNTSGDFQSPTSGFTAYLEATSGGKMHFNNRRTDDTFENEITATLGNDFHAGVPRDIRWFMQMNTLGQSNGILRVWVDDVLVIEDLTRTYRQNAGEQFQQVIVAPYAGATQTANAGVYVDQLFVYPVEQSTAQSITLTRSLLNQNGPGQFDFLFNHSERTSVGDHWLFVARLFGTQGAVSVDVITGGDSHTNVSTTLNWADGDATLKAVKVSVTTKTPGDHRAFGQLTNPTGGATLYGSIYTKQYLVVDDDTVAPDSEAVFFDTTWGGPYNGTSSQPYNSIYDAIANVGSKRYIYGKGIVVPDPAQSTQLPFASTSSTASIPVPATRANEDSRVIIRNWPGAGGGTLTITGHNGVSQTPSFGFISSSGESYQTFRKIIFENLVTTEGPIGAIWYQYANHINNTIENCTGTNMDGGAGANNSFATFNDGFGHKVWGCIGSEIKTAGDNNNGNTAFIYSYLANYISIHGCDFADTMSKGTFHKRTDVGDVSFCCRYNIYRNTDCFYAISGGGNPGHNGISVMYNVFNGIDAGVYHHADALDQQGASARSEFVGNIFIDCGQFAEGCIEAHGLENFAIYDNVFINCEYMFTDTRTYTTDFPWLMDHNLRFSTTGNTAAGVRSNLASLDYTSLDAAGLVSVGVVGACANDTIGNPLLTNAANDDYSFQAGSPGLSSSMSGTPAVIFPEKIGKANAA